MSSKVPCISLSSKNLLGAEESDENALHVSSITLRHDLNGDVLRNVPSSMPKTGHAGAQENNGFSSDESVLTVSLDDNVELEVLRNRSGSRAYLVHSARKHFLLIVSLSCAVAITAMAIVMLESFNRYELRPEVWHFLVVLRLAGLFSSVGGFCALFSVKFVFSYLGLACFRRNAYHRRHKISVVFNRFVMLLVFEDVFLRQYLRRVRSSQESDVSRALSSYLESPQLDGLLSDRVQAILLSPEGYIFDSLGLELGEVKSFFKSLLTTIVIEAHSQMHVPSELSGQWHPNEFRRHIENILSEKLSSLSAEHMSHLVNEMMSHYVGAVVTVVCVLSALAGTIVGVLFQFA